MVKKHSNKVILPKLIGADTELGNFLSGHDHPNGSGMMASSMLLNAISGIPAHLYHYYHYPVYQDISGRTHDNFSHTYSTTGYGSNARSYEHGCNLQDMGRMFLSETGGGAYIDLNHLEICMPEVLSARDYVIYNRVLHELAACACSTVNAQLTDTESLHVHANNSDGQSHSYGSHLNFLISRRCFDNIFNLKLQNLLFLASYQASSLIFTGQGKVGSENGHDWVDFQLAQRADFVETMVGQQTTYNRPLVNSRDESHAHEDMARLHVIFYDNVLSQGSLFLKAGVMQVVLSMIEAECIKNELILDDALRAVSDWSHDPSLSKKASTLDGKKYTAVEHQRAIFEQAENFVSSGTIDDKVVPDVHEIMGLWGDTLTLLESKDFNKLSSRLDWVLKYQILQCAKERHSLAWRSPQMKHLDLMYSSLNKAEGLYWPYEKSGALEKIVSEEEIKKCMESPPEETRAWFRSYLLSHAVNEMIEIERVDWDSIEFKLYERNSMGLSSYRRVRVDMDNPCGFTRREMEPLIRRVSSLHELISMLGKECSSNSYTMNSFPLT